MLNDPSKIRQLIEFQKAHPSFCEKLMNYYYNGILKPGDNFIDVGARVGHHLFPMARIVGPEGRGIGIEANPTAAQHLRDKIAGNADLEKTLTVVENAAADREGTENFFIRDEFSGWSSLYEEHVHPSEKGSVKTITVTFALIDDIVKNAGWDRCRFIKLDIEHAEFIALRGAVNMIKSMRPVICFENAPRRASKLNNYTMDEFMSFFEDANYELRDMFLNPVTRKRLAEDKFLPSYYLATPAEQEVVNDTFVSMASAAVMPIREALIATKAKA